MSDISTFFKKGKNSALGPKGLKMDQEGGGAKHEPRRAKTCVFLPQIHFILSRKFQLLSQIGHGAC